MLIETKQNVKIFPGLRYGITYRAWLRWWHMRDLQECLENIKKDKVGWRNLTWSCVQRRYWFNAAMQEVPLLSPCPPPAPPMLSKNVGGKFKYLNRKNSEFLAGNLNSRCKCKMQMQMLILMLMLMQMLQNANAKCNRLSVKPFIATALLLLYLFD